MPLDPLTPEQEFLAESLVELAKAEEDPNDGIEILARMVVRARSERDELIQQLVAHDHTIVIPKRE